MSILQRLAESCGIPGAVASARRMAATVAVALLAACGEDGGAPKPAAPAGAVPAPRSVRLQLNWMPEPEFGGIYAALQDGLFAREGIAVEVIAGSAGTPAAQMAASGQVEFAVVSGDQVLTLREKGGDLVGLFAIFHTSPMGVMVRADAPWRSLQDLWASDATVAMEAGLPFVRYLNRKYPGSKVRIVPTGTGLAAFEQGTVLAQQCFISAEPVQMELKGIPVRVFSLAEGGYDPYTVTIATRASHLREERETCAAFVRALREGWRRYLADPARYNPAIAKLNPGMTLAAMDVAARKQHDLVAPPGSGASEVGTMERARWDTLARQLVELGTLKAVPPVIDDVFWNAP
jgi:NitT/TauT family transport system substrate-binding protein